MLPPPTAAFQRPVIASSAVDSSDAGSLAGPDHSHSHSQSAGGGSASVAFHSSQNDSLFASFFLPLTFYKQLEYRSNTHPIFLRRTLQYGRAESTAESNQRKRRSDQITHNENKRRTPTNARANATTAAAVTAPTTTVSPFVHSRPRITHRPYVSPDDLLAVKLTAAAAAAEPTPTAGTDIDINREDIPLVSQTFSNTHISKRLEVKLTRICFRTKEQQHPPPPPVASAAASAIPVPPSSSTSSSSHAVVIPRSSTLHIESRLSLGGVTRSILSGSIEQSESESSKDSTRYHEIQVQFPTVNLFQQQKRRFKNPPSRTQHTTTTTHRTTHHTTTSPNTATAAAAPWTLQILFSSSAISSSPTSRFGSGRASRPDSSDDGVSLSFDSSSPVWMLTHVIEPCGPASSSPSSTGVATGGDASNMHSSSPPPSSSFVVPIHSVSSGQLVGSASVTLEWTYRMHKQPTTNIYPLRPIRHTPTPTKEAVLVAWTYAYTSDGSNSTPPPSAFASRDRDDSKVNTPTGHYEYHSHFGCILCNLTACHLLTFVQLIRHLEAAHSEFITFQCNAGNKIDLDIGTTNTAHTNTHGKEREKDDKPTVSLFEIIMRAKPEADNLLPILVGRSSKDLTSELRSLSADVSPSPSPSPLSPSDLLVSGSVLPIAPSGMTSTLQLRGLPRAFIDGWQHRQRHRTQTKTDATTNNNPPNATPYKYTHPVVDGSSASCGVIADPDLPHAFFAFIGDKFGAVRHRPNVRTRNKRVTNAANSNDASGHANADTTTSVKQLLHSSSTVAAAAAAAARSSPSMARLSESPPASTRHQAAPNAASASTGGATATSASPTMQVGGGAMVRGGGRNRSAQRLQSQSSNSALYSRQWYHASSGVPLAISELSYDSDDQVDEEWYIEQNGKLIDEFEDVSGSEKAIMKIWNEFILRKGATKSKEAIYADYLYPSVCASFARTCAPLIRPYLRHAFLCHLLTSWEFGLLESSHIEAIMRILDESADTIPIRAGMPFASFHAPVRSTKFQQPIGNIEQLLQVRQPKSPRKAHKSSDKTDKAASAASLDSRADGASPSPSPSPPPIIKHERVRTSLRSRANIKAARVEESSESDNEPHSSARSGNKSRPPSPATSPVDRDSDAAAAGTGGADGGGSSLAGSTPSPSIAAGSISVSVAAGATLHTVSDGVSVGAATSVTPNTTTTKSNKRANQSATSVAPTPNTTNKRKRASSPTDDDGESSDGASGSDSDGASGSPKKRYPLRHAHDESDVSDSDADAPGPPRTLRSGGAVASGVHSSKRRKSGAQRNLTRNAGGRFTTAK